MVRWTETAKLAGKLLCRSKPYTNLRRSEHVAGGRPFHDPHAEEARQGRLEALAKAEGGPSLRQAQDEGAKARSLLRCRLVLAVMSGLYDPHGDQGLFYYLQISGYGRAALANVLNAKDPFALPPAEIVRRILTKLPQY